MRARLEIHFDGTTPGLAEHRLDLSSFVDALQALTAGLRRTASAIVNDATETSAVGRVTRKAELHVFLEKLLPGSLGVAFAIEPPEVAPGDSFPLFDDLAVLSTKRFVVGLKKESEQVYQNAAARRFLRKLPAGLTAQRYEVYEGEKQVLEVSIGEVNLPAEPEELPSVIRASARVLGVTFQPQAEVRLDVAGTTFACTASDALVDKAITLRGEDVQVVAVVIAPSKARLLWLSRPADYPRLLNREERADHVLVRWEKTLEILGR